MMRFAKSPMLALRAAALMFAAMLATWPLHAGAEDDASTLERNVKAAFLYKFTAYVEWPAAAFAAPDSPIVIGVAGDDALAAELGRITANRQVAGRPLTVRRVADSDNLGGLHMLYLGHGETARIPQFVRALQSRPTLLVTEAEGARAQGSIISFVVVDGRVRFNIANDEAEKRGLKLSSRLLQVAQNLQGVTQ
jgi:YfiR/HmsC-like